MKEIRYTSQYKKDLKKFLNQPKKLTALQDVINKLKNEETLPKKYRLHTLKGEYTGCWECHIEGDFLLIWYDEENETLALFRLGSHSELFKN